MPVPRSLSPGLGVSMTGAGGGGRMSREATTLLEPVRWRAPPPSPAYRPLEPWGGRVQPVPAAAMGAGVCPAPPLADHWRRGWGPGLCVEPSW